MIHHVCEECVFLQHAQYKCNTCPHEFLDMKQLKKHVKVEHDKVVLPVKTFVCYDCHYTRTTALKLNKESVHQKRLTMSPYSVKDNLFV